MKQFLKSRPELGGLGSQLSPCSVHRLLFRQTPSCRSLTVSESTGQVPRSTDSDAGELLGPLHDFLPSSCQLLPLTHTLTLHFTVCTGLLFLCSFPRALMAFFLITTATHVHSYTKVKYYRNACLPTPQNSP